MLAGVLAGVVIAILGIVIFDVGALGAIGLLLLCPFVGAILVGMAE